MGRGLARVQERPGVDSTLPACIVEAGLVGDRCDHTSHSSKDVLLEIARRRSSPSVVRASGICGEGWCGHPAGCELCDCLVPTKRRAIRQCRASSMMPASFWGWRVHGPDSIKSLRVRREGNLVPSSARIKTFSTETKRIPEPKQTKTQAKSQVTRATIGRMHPPPPPIKGRRQKRNENKIKTKGFSKQGI